ncbi:MAG: ABC transporter permease [Deltaproteobacteria bacterium]
MNVLGTFTLLRKEILRFRRVSLQTLFAPALSTLLYLWVVTHAVISHSASPASRAYITFLVPGFALMVALQNAFANSSSSLMQSKLTGNLVFLLVAPLSPWEILAAFSLASALRGALVSLLVTGVARIFVPFPCEHVVVVAVFTLVGGALLGALGVLAAVRARKFDELAAFQNLVVVPMTFLSGVFYAVDALPAGWRALSRANPLYYLVDGCRYGFLGHAERPPILSLGVALLATLVVSTLAARALARDARIRP